MVDTPDQLYMFVCLALTAWLQLQHVLDMQFDLDMTVLYGCTKGVCAGYSKKEFWYCTSYVSAEEQRAAACLSAVH